MPTYKIDGAKFNNIDEMKAALWPLYQAKMSESDFDKYLKDNMQVID